MLAKVVAAVDLLELEDSLAAGSDVGYMRVLVTLASLHSPWAQL